MYNTPRSAVPAKKWKPAPTLMSKNQRRSYSATQWREHDMQDDEGFEQNQSLYHEAGEFAVEQIQPLEHPLPKHIMAALTLLEQAQFKQTAQAKKQKKIEEAKKGPVALNAKGDESENLHLPFVPTNYTPVGWDGKPLAEAADDEFEADEALAMQAEDDVDLEQDAKTQLEEDLGFEENEVSQKQDALSEDADELEENVNEQPEGDTSELKADEASSEDSSSDMSEQEDKEPSAEEKKQASSKEEEISEKASAQQYQLSEEDSDSDQNKDRQETSDDSELKAQADSDQESQDVAEEFEEDSAIDAKSVKDSTEEDSTEELSESDLENEGSVLSADQQSDLEDQADEQEIEQEDEIPEEPVVQGIPEEEVVLREQSHYLRGLEDGKKQIRKDLEQKVNDQCAVLSGVSEQLNQLLQDSNKLYEPLKRLSLHIAEQLMIGELSQPTTMIERLVQRCLDEMNIPTQGLVTVELNEKDKSLLEAQDSKLLQGMRLETSADLLPGSVRVMANDMIMEDFVQDRLGAVVKSLKIDESQWQKQSEIMPSKDETEPEGEM